MEMVHTFPAAELKTLTAGGARQNERVSLPVFGRAAAGRRCEKLG